VIEDRRLIKRIRCIHDRSREAYGTLRAWNEPRAAKAQPAASIVWPDCADHTASSRIDLRVHLRSSTTVNAVMKP
jgi:hypothetical protein